MPLHPSRIVKRFFIALLLFGLNSVYAQQTITGKIINKTGNAPISGASIKVKGSNVGTQTNDAGTFSINVPKNNSVLEISVVGFENMEIPVNGRASLGTLSLNPTASTLNEIVVTGYTTQRKKDITGSVSVVSAKELVANPGSNVETLLQGKASGVTVGTSGVPGAGASIRIRGFTTFQQNEPLYVVDGARVGSISDLNPNDIESLQVLKDASSAAAYGAAAANGVIIITTKRGKGKPKVSYDAYYGVQSLTKQFDLLNTEEYGRYLYLLQKGANPSGKFFNLGQYNGGKDSTDVPVIPEYILAGTASGLQAG